MDNVLFAYVWKRESMGVGNIRDCCYTHFKAHYLTFSYL